MTILVTGGATRIGGMIVNHLCSLGHHVVAHYFQSHEEARVLKEKWGTRVSFLCSDLTTEEGMIALVESLQSQNIVLEGLVNNAAHFIRQPIQEYDRNDAERMWRLNVQVPLELIHHTLDYFGPDAAIVNLIDNASENRPWPNHSVYASTKAGLLASTRSLAVELAPKIRVNAVGPGLIGFEGDSHPTNLIAKIPMKRSGDVQEVVDTVYFLLTGPKYITGQMICVDGGWSIAPMCHARCLRLCRNLVRERRPSDHRPWPGASTGP